MMTRTFFIIPAIFLSVFLVSFAGKEKQQAPKATVRTLIIDPGHGGIDPGARGSFSHEADVALSVSLKFGQAIEREFSDVKVIYTRTTDVMAGNKRTKDEGLRYRADLANSSGGDLFIAIHCNAAPPHQHKEIIGYRTEMVTGGR